MENWNPTPTSHGDPLQPKRPALVSTNTKAFQKILTGISKDTLKYFSRCSFPSKMTAAPPPTGGWAGQLLLRWIPFNTLLPMSCSLWSNTFTRVSKQLNDAWVKSSVQKQWGMRYVKSQEDVKDFHEQIQDLFIASEMNGPHCLKNHHFKVLKKLKK